MGYPETAVVFAVIVTLSSLMMLRAVRRKHALILAGSERPASRGLVILAQATLIVYYLAILRIALMPLPWRREAVLWAFFAAAVLSIWGGLEVVLRLVARQELHQEPRR